MTRQHRWHRAFAAGSALLLWPWHAEAHLVTTGLGPVYDGIGHLLVTPEDLLPVLALALCARLAGRWSGAARAGCVPQRLARGRLRRPARARAASVPDPGPVVAHPRHARGGGLALALTGGHGPGGRSWPGAWRAQWRGHAAGGCWDPGAAGYSRCALLCS